MSQITNSSPSLSWVNQLPFPPLSPLSSVCGDFRNSCCFPVFPVIHWSSYMLRTPYAALSSWSLNRDEMDPSQPSPTLSHGVLLAADKERGPCYLYITVMEQATCMASGGALHAEGSVTQPPRLQIENSMWLMSPLPFLIIFWLRFNHKSDNNSAAK